MLIEIEWKTILIIVVEFVSEQKIARKITLQCTPHGFSIDIVCPKAVDGAVGI
jgi:hypothetical protein